MTLALGVPFTHQNVCKPLIAYVDKTLTDPLNFFFVFFKL